MTASKDIDQLSGIREKAEAELANLERRRAEIREIEDRAASLASFERQAGERASAIEARAAEAESRVAEAAKELSDINEASKKANMAADAYRASRISDAEALATAAEGRARQAEAAAHLVVHELRAAERTADGHERHAMRGKLRHRRQDGRLLAAWRRWRRKCKRQTSDTLRLALCAALRTALKRRRHEHARRLAHQRASLPQLAGAVGSEATRQHHRASATSPAGANVPVEEALHLRGHHAETAAENSASGPGEQSCARSGTAVAPPLTASQCQR
jgi:DNA repair exonuclease SbcCD ATPase subunit